MPESVRLIVNGGEHDLTVDPNWRLLTVLRDVLGLTGTKYGCGEGECGACTVLVGGQGSGAGGQGSGVGAGGQGPGVRGRGIRAGAVMRR